jgi:hypothetical protein
MSAASNVFRSDATALRLCGENTAYVSIRQHTSAYVSIRQHTCTLRLGSHMSAYLRFCGDSRNAKELSIRQNTSAYVSIRQSAYGSIRRHTSEYFSIRLMRQTFVFVATVGMPRSSGTRCESSKCADKSLPTSQASSCMRWSRVASATSECPNIYKCL